MLKHQKIPAFLAVTLIWILAMTGLILAKQPIRSIDGIVTEVTDGDTLKLKTTDETKLKIRLYGIDAPERQRMNRRKGIISKPGQPYAEEAKKALQDIVLGQKVRIDIMDIDRYRRMVSIVWYSGRNINLEMLTMGLAEAYRQYLREPYRSHFLKAEKEAQSNRLGIWSLGSDYECPAEFRQRMRIRGD
jgi:micrococcal nuclease